MKSTNRILSIVLILMFLVGMVPKSSFAAAVSVDTVYSQAAEAIDSEYTYDGTDLGATLSESSTTFKVWAPTATEVNINLYSTGSDSEDGASKLGTHVMSKDMVNESWNGVWKATIEGDLKNIYYTYTITAENTTNTAKTTKETQDIYSYATGVNGKRSLVCDMDMTDPDGWENDSHVLTDNQNQSVIWDIHVKDFSYDPSSGVSDTNRGKYLAFTENGTTVNAMGITPTCIDYLKELGITTVKLLPIFDFQAVDEEKSQSQYDFGYNPLNLAVPEGSYSSNPFDGNVRINELKQMVMALHNAGISVIMDIDFSHTFSTDSAFQSTVPNYYYRMTRTGAFSNGSGKGNELASERYMMRKYIIDTCLHWINEYHLDGLNFKDIGLMDVETVNILRAELDKVDPRIIMMGNSGAVSDSYHPTNTCSGVPFNHATQANASMIDERVALYNQTCSEGLAGIPTVIDALDKGFVQGNGYYARNLRQAIRANSASTYIWESTAPSQCVNYSCTNETLTLYDKLVLSYGDSDFDAPKETVIRANKLAAAILFSSQGMVSMLGGEEALRSKDGSNTASMTANSIKWENFVEYANVSAYYKGLLQIRANFAPLTAADNAYENSFIFNHNFTAITNHIAYTVANDTENQWSKLAFIFNSDTHAASITLKDTSVTEWVVIADNQSAGVEKLYEVSGSTFSVPAQSAVIAVEKQSFEAVSVATELGKVTVNYIDSLSGDKIAPSTILQGTIGTKYETSPYMASPVSDMIPDSTEGETVGVFQKEAQEVTYSYTEKKKGYVLVNHLLESDGQLISREAFEGQPGDNYETREIQILGYKVNSDRLPANYIGTIPEDGTVEQINYYYTKVTPEIKINIKHNGNLTWEPTLWIWGNDIYGNDTQNYSPDSTAVWPGINATDNDGDGWYNYSFTFNDIGSFSIIVSKNGHTQTNDIVGIVDDQIWIIIDDESIYSGNYCTFYSDNPEINPDAPEIVFNSKYSPSASAAIFSELDKYYDGKPAELPEDGYACGNGDSVKIKWYKNHMGSLGEEVVPIDVGTYFVEVSNGNISAQKFFRIFKANLQSPEGIVAVDETIIGQNDGKLTNVDSTMEYRKEGETNYIAITGTEVLNLAPGKYYVRYAETENHRASPDKEVTISVGGKKTATITDVSDISKTYDGTAVKNPTYTYTDGADGQITVNWYADNNGTKGDSLAEAPTNAGTYWVGVSASEGASYNAVDEVSSQFTIAKANPAIETAPTASRVIIGNTLSASELTDGVASVSGTFAWKDGSELLDTEGTARKTVVFTPEDSTNYNTLELDVDVSVILCDTESGEHSFTNLQKNEAEHWYICINCDAEMPNSREKHKDGTPTCTDKAKCSVCAEEYGEANGHGETEIKNEMPATCDAEGYTGDKHCTICGEKLESGAHTPKTEHSYEWVIDKEPTETETGIKHEECSACKDKRNVDTVIPKTETDSPQTGDYSKTMLWMILACISTVGIVATTALGKKKRYQA